MSNDETGAVDQTDLEKFSRMFKALSNPHRLRIMLELASCSAEQGALATDEDEVENCQHEFAESLGLAPSTISHHFKELREAGLMRTRREGKKIIVWIDTDALNAIRRLFT